MKLIKYPDDFLDKKVNEVDLLNPGFDPKELKKQMVDLMLASKGIGLSATQIGLNAQVFVTGENANNAIICINPEVLQHTEETVIDTEGCLSFPNVYVKVKRPKEILVKYYDEKLKEISTKVIGYSAKCFLHEWDHLQGVTFKDRVSKLKWDMAQKKASKLRNINA